MPDIASDTNAPTPIHLHKYIQEPLHEFVINGAYSKSAVTEQEALDDYDAAGSPFGEVENIEQTCGLEGEHCERCEMERLHGWLAHAEVIAVRDAPDTHGKRRLLLDLKTTTGGKVTVAFEFTDESK